MSLIRIPAAAKHMGVCRQQAARILLAKQRRHPDIEILTRETPESAWWVNVSGLARVKELEQNKSTADLSQRVGLLESDVQSVRRKIDRLELRLSSMCDAGKRAR